MERPLSLKQSAVVVSILASLWLLKHPYNGIWHDGVIYTFMALNKLHPDIYADDLFLKFGSYGSYTIFPQIYAVFIQYFGIYKSALVLTVVGQLLWIIAAVTLFRTFLKGKELYISLAILFFMRSYYWGFNVFQYAEPFVNPRIFSEALCILGTTYILRTRYIIAAVLLFVSFFIHPLMTLSAGLIMYVYLILSYPRVLFSSPIFAAAIFLLGLLNIEPFAGIFRIISPAWYQIIKERFFYLLSVQLPVKDWTGLFFTLAITISACLFSKDILRRLFLASVIGALCGLLIHIIGGEYLRNEFIIQIQTWRSLWFLQFISALGAAVLIINILKYEENRLFLCSFLILTWYCISLGIISFVITFLFIYFAFKASKNTLPAIQIKNPLIFIILILCIVSPDIIPFGRMILKSNFNQVLLSELANYSLFNIFLPLILFLVISFFYYHCDDRPSFKVIILSFVVLILSLTVWDRQSSWSKMLESNNDDASFFRTILPQDSIILWDASSEIPWLGARRTSYISTQQGCGALYNSRTAFEYAKRVNAVIPLMDEKLLGSKKAGFIMDRGFDKKKFAANYPEVCRKAEELDYIVSTVNVSGKAMVHWHSTVPFTKIIVSQDGTFEEIKDNDFYLYDCQKFKFK